MCGIIGYIGEKEARSIVLTGLKQLEYRGYDSVGIAVVKNNEITVFKDKGRVNHLCDLIDANVDGSIAIGHTRWATHGEPNKVNSHPHTSNSGRFTIVHNGVIDNYKILKATKLQSFKFYSETDTEVIVNLLEYYASKMDVESAIKKTMVHLEGSYALLILDKMHLDRIYVAKNKTPLLIGISKKGIMLASDTTPLAGICSKYCSLEDHTFAVIHKNDFELYDVVGLVKEKEIKDLTLTAGDVSKGDYPHFMLKEIFEQPSIIRNLISNYFIDDQINVDTGIIQMIKSCNKINFVACGTSMHASYMAKYYFEKLCNIPTEVFCASELVYSTPLILDKPCFVFVSQSGETADSIAVMKNVKAKGFPILAITNTEISSMVSLADYNLNIYAGKEIAVASTKAYVAQIVTCAILAKAVSGKKTNLKNNLNKVAISMESILDQAELIENLAREIQNTQDAFFIGRGIDYWACMEASLKLKEITYIHTEAFSSGELKHGSIALIDKGTPVIAICTQEGTNAIVRSNLMETKSRGALTKVISFESLSFVDDDIIVPNVAHYLSPLVTIVVTQLLAYYTAVLKGNDVDKPKNLAKSVTVE